MKKSINIFIVIFCIVVFLIISMYLFVQWRFNYLVKTNQIVNCCPCKGEMAMYAVCCDCTEHLNVLEKFEYIINVN